MAPWCWIVVTASLTVGVDALARHLRRRLHH